MLTAVVIVIFVRLIYLPARLFILGWFGLQILSVLFGSQPGGGVAFFAHIGGFIAGWLLVRIMGRRPHWRTRRFSF